MFVEIAACLREIQWNLGIRDTQGTQNNRITIIFVEIAACLREIQWNLGIRDTQGTVKNCPEF